jgi:hypothetical protein
MDDKELERIKSTKSRINELAKELDKEKGLSIQKSINDLVKYDLQRKQRKGGLEMNKLKRLFYKTKDFGMFVGALTILTYGLYQFMKEDNFPKKNEIFNHEDYKEYFMDYVPTDITGDGFPDYVYAVYDINKDSIADVSAFYPVIGTFNGKLLTTKHASIVFVDKNNKKPIDYVLSDKDGNKTLESKVRHPESPIQK